MLGLKNHKFSISDKNVNLYKFICKLEDNNIPFEIDLENDAIKLDPIYFFKNWNIIESDFSSNKIKEIQRDDSTVDYYLPKFHDGYLHITEDFRIDPFTANFSDGELCVNNGLEILLDIYKGSNRSRCIHMYDSLRTLITWGTLSESIINNLLKHKTSARGYLSEIAYSTCKVKFIDSKSYDDFTSLNTFPRCIPWKDYITGDSGVWLTNLRYFCNQDFVNYPEFELIFENIESDIKDIVKFVEKVGNKIVFELGTDFVFEIYNQLTCILRFKDNSRFFNYSTRSYSSSITFDIFSKL